MDSNRVREILDAIQKVRIAVYGDFALDAYWILDPEGGEISVETGIRTQAVSRHYYTLGGASNVVANLAALRPGGMQVIGAIGEDIFGRELVRQLDALDVDTGAFVQQEEDFDTVTFAKRYLEDQEQARIDFGFLNKRSGATDQRLLDSLEKALQEKDVVIFNQQVPGSLNRQAFIDGANALFKQYQDTPVILDSRHYGERFHNVIRKTNEVEAALLNGEKAEPDDVFSLEQVRKFAEGLFEQSERPLFITRGNRGILAVDRSGIHLVPGIQLMKKLDPVGAGDTTLAALGACLGAGIPPSEAAEFANFAAAVTVQKLFQTGTASGDEILEVSQEPNYLYQPELAEDLRLATYHDQTDIELCVPRGSLELGHIKHAVFDHDGTVSVLREGWEQVMQPVMMKAILGDKYDTAEPQLFNEVRTRVRNFIDQTTGIQTILQMEALADIVREFGLVPEDEILDKFGYKEIYNDALMEMVNQRIARFESGQLNLSDYTLKGAVDFLARLRETGVTLYLASGTDRDDVRNEAEVLSYADLFDGGIYGAVGDVSKYSKKMVIDNIIKENGLKGTELAVFGDGPVEIRECRRFGGIAVGVASDEVRRHGLNASKRSRLIKAGAQVLVPDFSQSDQLYRFLFRND